MRGKTEKNRTVFDYTGNASIHIFRGFNHGGQYPVLWVAAGCPAMVAFAFLTNKVFVFRSKSFAAKQVLRELTSFVGARLFSLAVDTAGMWLLVDVLSWNDWLAKILMNVIVVVINYVFSKLFIFRRPQ